MTIHEIKIEPEYFEKVGSGLKTFEVRIEDRNYQNGDVLVLREWRNQMYTGRRIEATITDVYRGEYCREGYCLISFQLSFPSLPKIPVSAYLALYDMYLQVCKECDVLREGKV